MVAESRKAMWPSSSGSKAPPPSPLKTWQRPAAAPTTRSSPACWPACPGSITAATRLRARFTRPTVPRYLHSPAPRHCDASRNPDRPGGHEWRWIPASVGVNRASTLQSPPPLLRYRRRYRLGAPLGNDDSGHNRRPADHKRQRQRLAQEDHAQCYASGAMRYWRLATCVTGRTLSA